MQYENLCTSKSFATLGSSDVYFRKEVLSARCILESSDRCPNILTVAPPNNLVLRVPCRPPIIPVCGRTYHAVCLKSRWPSLGAYGRGPERKTARTVRAVYGGRRTIFLQRNGHPLFLRPPIRQAPRNSRSLRGRLSAPEESHSTNGANSISSGSAASAAFRTSYRKPAR